MLEIISEDKLVAVQFLQGGVVRLTFKETAASDAMFNRVLVYQDIPLRIARARTDVRTVFYLRYLPIEVPDGIVSPLFASFGAVLSVRHSKYNGLSSLCDGNRVVTLDLTSDVTFFVRISDWNCRLNKCHSATVVVKLVIVPVIALSLACAGVIVSLVTRPESVSVVGVLRYPLTLPLLVLRPHLLILVPSLIWPLMFGSCLSNGASSLFQSLLRLMFNPPQKILIIPVLLFPVIGGSPLKRCPLLPRRRLGW